MYRLTFTEKENRGDGLILMRESGNREEDHMTLENTIFQSFSFFFYKTRIIKVEML